MVACNAHDKKNIVWNGKTYDKTNKYDIVILYTDSGKQRCDVFLLGVRLQEPS